jgi:hypothetical protein
MIKPPPTLLATREHQADNIQGFLELAAAEIMQEFAAAGNFAMAIPGPSVEKEELTREWTAGSYFYGSTH